MFKEYMTAKELFKGCNEDKNKKKILILYANYLFGLYKRPLKKDDFAKSGRVSHITIRRLFGTFHNFYQESNLPTSRRKPNMSKDEMKKYFITHKKINENGCWVSNIGHKHGNEGRIKIKYQGKQWFRHRLSYYLFIGELRSDMVIKHVCNNPPCFNPKHLIQDTHKNNIKDAFRDGLFENCTRENRKIKIEPLTDPYNYKELIEYIKNNCYITIDNEWIWKKIGMLSPSGYPVKRIQYKNYFLHKLVLANKLGKKYEEIKIARHVLPTGNKPNKLDLNPDHLIEGSLQDNAYDSRKYSKSYKLSTNKVKIIIRDLNNWDFNKRGEKSKFDLHWSTKFNVDKTTISKIRLNKSHKYLDREEGGKGCDA